MSTERRVGVIAMTEDWHAGTWEHGCGRIVEADMEPADDACPIDCYGTEWRPQILAVWHPQEGQCGQIKCARCGNEFVGYNGERTAGWHCKGCGGTIVPQTQHTELLAEPNEPTETEQAQLFGGDHA